ncbi:MAG: phosphoenolpyruvate carboxykinase (ATP) [Bdellovibrionota bacterium]
MESNLVPKIPRIHAKTIHRNPSVASLYERAIKENSATKPCAVSSVGALISYSGAKTGRSPLDKRIVREEQTEKDIWWGKVNIPLSESSFETNLDVAVNFLNSKEEIYVIDGFAGCRLRERIKVRILCARPYHALFMRNMLIRPTSEERESYGEPDWVIYNAGQFPAALHVDGVSSETSIDVDFKKRELVILGTEYAGCMKKGVFTILNYLLPRKGILSMHCAANEGRSGDTTLFFGLSGTGKTTLSADPERRLIGDDEHGWDDEGIFNIEGGCYAKTANLSEENEPEIWKAIRFGSVLENVVYDPDSHVVQFDDVSITENTRVAYPLEYMEGAKLPALGGHPKNIFFLTCDAYGVLPAISRLSPAQAMYHFMSGYSAKVAGTEQGVKKPEATFSACFGAAFMVWHPAKYAQLLSDKMDKQGVNVWLVNTGWSGGGYGVGERIPVKLTRAMVRAALSGNLERSDFEKEEHFGLEIPLVCAGVPAEVLSPMKCWRDKAAYAVAAKNLADLFRKNFEQYRVQSSAEVLAAGPPSR